jgi:hypothetical protein
MNVCRDDNLIAQVGGATTEFHRMNLMNLNRLTAQPPLNAQAVVESIRCVAVKRDTHYFSILYKSIFARRVARSSENQA